MNQNGDEKRIQQLFSEMSDGDRLRTPAFARVVQGASSSTSLFRIGLSRRLVFAFATLCVVMIAFALAFILPPLLQRDDTSSTKNDSGRKEANLDVYRDQLAELASDMEHGLIDSKQHDQDREELERRLLEDLSTTDQAKPKQSKLAFDGRSYV